MSHLLASDGQNTGASASASILPMNVQGMISFKIDWLDLLAVQGTLKSLLQHHSSKASILQCSAFFMVQYKIRSLKKNKDCTSEEKRKEMGPGEVLGCGRMGAVLSVRRVSTLGSCSRTWGPGNVHTQSVMPPQ